MGPRTPNGRGRPLGPLSQAIRAFILNTRAQGRYRLATVRGWYYAAEVAGIVPKEESRGYRPVQKQILAMRRLGILPWDAISDATRWQRKPTTYGSVEDALNQFIRTYRRDLWTAQNVRIEVWLEKDALAGVVAQATYPWDVALMVSRGTSSETFLYEAAQEAKAAWEGDSITTHVFTLYDHDAAGLRCARAVEAGLNRLSDGAPIVFQHLAVTPEQIRDWSLPTRPPKANDPEAKKFRGPAVELDAIPPEQLIALVNDAIVALVDEDMWEIEKEVERQEREGLKKFLGES